LKVDFRPFIQVEGVPVKDFRQHRIDILAHTGVIFTSRTAVDNYFRIAEELRITIPDTMKYFCISEATAFYLQKYIVYRKRKIFYGKGTFADLMEIIKKHKDEKFLYHFLIHIKKKFLKNLNKQK
jgi:uroporphyrinogen-III synthase